MTYLWAFIIGGALCGIGQILVDKTKLTPARILVMYVVIGVILGSFGIYDKLIDFAGAGATVPISGFGYALAKGAIEEVEAMGILGAFAGGLRATASGITVAIVFGYLAALVANPKSKS